MTSNSDNIDWKRLWQLVSGIHYSTPQETVYKELLNFSKKLQDGLLQFEPAEATSTKLEALLKEKKQEKLLEFTERLQDILDLESQQCWDMLCYYLANEYRGSASALSVLVSTENDMSTLLDDIWGYYTLQRMLVLKIVKNLLLFYHVPSHPYQKEYKQIVDKITLSNLCSSYMKQLEKLCDESPPSRLVAGRYFDYEAKLVAWSERNSKEINETVHILLLIREHMPFKVEDIKRILHSITQEAFGKQQSYLSASDNRHAQLMNRVSYSMVILFLKCLDYEAVKSEGVDFMQNLIATLEGPVAKLYHDPESGPILLSWMLLNLLNEPDLYENVEKCLRYRRFGKRALDLGCFGYMRDMLSCSMFQDDSLVSRIARRVVYNILSNMCNLFDGDGSCAQYANIYELLAELLSWPSMAKVFCSSEDRGVHSLFKTLLEEFPVDFRHLSLVARALTKAGMDQYVKQQLQALPIFTDIYDESKYSLQSLGDEAEEYILRGAVQPYKRIDYTIPADTSCVVTSRKEDYFVHFRHPVNYYNVLHHEINCLLQETSQLHGDYTNNERIYRVQDGLHCLETALQHVKQLSDISEEMVHPTEMTIDLLSKFRGVQHPPVELLAKCLDICTALLPLAANEIYTRVVNLNILPVVSTDDSATDDYRQYANGSYFDSRLVGRILVDVEKKLDSFPFLLSYLRFLRAYTKLGRSTYMQIEIPGLVFLLLEVFSHMHAWHFKSPLEKTTIYSEILSFLCDVLDIVAMVDDDDDSSENKNKQLLRDICIYSLLNMENGIVLLRFIAIGNASLQHTMEMESNWIKQSKANATYLVRQAMRILMQLLRFKSVVFKDAELSPLEALIYTQPKQRDTLRIIQMVTGYMSNIFDRGLPLLSCRLLRRIALEFNMSLLACLDMEPDQIRLTFLERLPDPLESDHLKVAILELVEACIEKQPGMTEAFFKINFDQEKRLFGKESGNIPIADSILTYLEDYIEAVAQEPHTVCNALPCEIMNIFHSLWNNNMQILVEDLLEVPSFWSKFTKPLFGKLQGDVRAYTQLLNILALEVFATNSHSNRDLEAVITQFFERDHIIKWLDFVFDMPNTPFCKPLSHQLVDDEAPEWLRRLQSFKRFLFIMLNTQPRFVDIPRKELKCIAEKTLRALVLRAEYTEDMRPFILLSELYLSLLLSFKNGYSETRKESTEMLDDILKVLNRVVVCYEDLHVRAKEACLSIAIKTVELLNEELLSDPAIALNFLHSVVCMICFELDNLENCVRQEMHSATAVASKKPKIVVETSQMWSTNSLILSLNLLKSVANSFQNSGPSNWDLPFIANRVFPRLLSCTGHIVQSAARRKLSKQLLDVLIVFAKGNCSVEFLHCDVGDYLWLKLLPPKELVRVNYPPPLQTLSTEEWRAEKWWPVYARGIEFITLLFSKHKHHFLNDMLQFVGIHEEYLLDALLLAKQSLEPAAMDLIKKTVTLVAELVPYEKQWNLEHPRSLFNLMRSLQMIMGHAISLFNQPRNLKRLVAGRNPQISPCRISENLGIFDECIVAFNDLTEIIILCAKCLLRFSPPLLDLICSPEIAIQKWQPLFEIHFGAPKLSENQVALSFGTVLSIVGVYTKVLSLQNYGFHEVPLNELPAMSEDNSKLPSSSSKIISNCSQTSDTVVSPQSQSHRHFSKSLSVASVSSTSCPPTELLSNLDGELCLMALEHILSLAASQSMLALKNSKLPLREKQIIRREISTELITYHEFVRKKVLIDYREHKDMWYRRKYGQVAMPVYEEMESPNLTSQGSSSSEAPKRHSSDLRHSMRVNVVRRLHLQQRQQQEQQQQQQRDSPPSRSARLAFETTHDISPISSMTELQRDREGSDPVVASTPQTSMETCNDDDDNGTEDDDSEEIEYFAPDDERYSPLSYVQLVEEDYLHFMSNLFMVICQCD